MRLILLLVLTLAGACQKDNSNVPSSLSGKTLKGTITSASGAFAGLEGYQFTTQFVSDNQFETKSAAGTLESSGQYDLKKNRLILQSNGGLHPDESVEIKLKFTDSKSGVYEAHPLSGASGEQTGIFSLQ